MRPSTLVLSLPALSLLLGCAMTACGGAETIPVGRADQKIQTKPDGGRTGDGTTCSWDTPESSDGTTTAIPTGPWKVGDVVPSGDCNSCECTVDGIVCTTMSCPSPGDTCEYGGKTYARGDSFPATDGCNTCSCTEHGVGCTEMACPTSCLVNGKVYQEGESWTEDCNTCSCVGGQAGCTKIACN